MKRAYLIIAVVVFSLLVWLPFVMKVKLPGWGMDFSAGTKILWQNFDGPNYLIVEKTWYNKAAIEAKFSSPLPAEYYPAHFPLYPAIIWVFNTFMKGPSAMLVATLLGSVLCFLMLYKYLKEFGLSKNPLWLCLVFLVLPARWVAVRAVGSPEPWFMLFIIASIFYFRKEKFWLAGLFGILAQLTKSPAIILLGAYGIYALVESIKLKKIQFKYLPLLIQLLAVGGLFWFYGVRTGDFLAYFHSGDNIHLFWPPFSVFTPLGQNWVGSFWLEDIIWTWLIFGLGIAKLKEKKMTIEMYFAGLFFLATLTVAHRDISRYILPIAPFVLIGWDDLIQKKEFKIVLAIMLIPILLFSWNFLLNNMSAIADWAPYL
jgi:Gpi18-like mannosyltransferase